MSIKEKMLDTVIRVYGFENKSTILFANAIENNKSVYELKVLAHKLGVKVEG